MFYNEELVVLKTELDKFAVELAVEIGARFNYNFESNTKACIFNDIEKIEVLYDLTEKCLKTQIEVSFTYDEKTEGIKTSVVVADTFKELNVESIAKHLISFINADLNDLESVGGSPNDEFDDFKIKREEVKQ